MIKGEYSILAVILHLFLLGVAGVMFWQMSPLYTTGEIGAGDILFYVTVPVYVIFVLFAVISPFVSIKKIIIDDTSIVYRYLLMKKSFNLQEIDGYFTMDLPSRDATYETIYPVSRNRILPPVSSFYISNYDEVKKSVPFRKMGKVKFSWKNYMTVLLSKKYNELDR